MSQFYHQRSDSLYEYFQLDATVFLQVPSKKDLEALLLTHGTQILLPVGLTIKSPKDQFNKEKGREAAIKNTQLAVFQFIDMVVDGTKHIFRFTTKIEHNNKKYFVRAELTTVAESDFVRFIGGLVDG